MDFIEKYFGLAFDRIKDTKSDYRYPKFVDFILDNIKQEMKQDIKTEEDIILATAHAAIALLIISENIVQELSKK